MQITREWLDGISDDKGLTAGQIKVLDIHCAGAPYVGKLIDDQVANFLAGCRGYRGMSQELLAWVALR